MSETHDTPVLIVGGGPAGLSAALLLARYGLRPVLVERRAGASAHPRARGLNVRTMEILRALGLEAPVQAAGEPLRRSTLMLFVESLAGREIRRVPEADLVLTGAALETLTPCAWTQCAQDDLEPLLAGAARTAGAELRFGLELAGFAQDPGGVTCRLRGPDGAERSLRAAYLLAADGARSPLRQALGLARHGPGAMGDYVNIYFRADLGALVEGRWFGICFVDNPRLSGVVLAVNNRDRWLLNVELPPGEDPAGFTPERCAELVRAAVGQAELPVELLSVQPWQATALVAERMRAGRVLLLGDAAHTAPPAGAFGLNLAVQDAHNLAWKLAAVLGGAAGPALLDSYEAERLPLARAIVGRAARDFGAERPDAPVPQHAGDPALPPAEDGALAQVQAVLGQRYAAGALLPDQGPAAGQPGTRAPHLWLQRDGRRISTLDLCDGPWVLLFGAGGAAWGAAAAALAGQTGAGLRAYALGPHGDLAGDTDAWAAAYGLRAGGAALIRPDGVVGWRSPEPPADPRAALGAALDRLLARR